MQQMAQQTEGIEQQNGLDQIRDLIKSRMLEKGGGKLPQTYAAASEEIGITPSALNFFVIGTTKNLDPGTVIRLSKYLQQSPFALLRLAGHPQIERILREALNLSNEDVMLNDPSLVRIARLLRPLDETDRATVANSIAPIARTLRENRAKYTVVVTNNEPSEEDAPPRRRRK